MAMNGAGAAAFGKRRHHRRGVMSEINVTPMVDVMLVLLIIFMVSARLLTVGVPLELPQSQAKSLDQDKEPLTISVNLQGQIYLQNTEIAVDELVPKLKAIAEARGGMDERIYVRGDRKVDYGTVMKVMDGFPAPGSTGSRSSRRSSRGLDGDRSGNDGDRRHHTDPRRGVLRRGDRRVDRCAHRGPDLERAQLRGQAARRPIDGNDADRHHLGERLLAADRRRAQCAEGRECAPACRQGRRTQAR